MFILTKIVLWKMKNQYLVFNNTKNFPIGQSEQIINDTIQLVVIA